MTQGNWQSSGGWPPAQHPWSQQSWQPNQSAPAQQAHVGSNPAARPAQPPYQPQHAPYLPWRPNSSQQPIGGYAPQPQQFAPPVGLPSYLAARPTPSGAQPGQYYQPGFYPPPKRRGVSRLVLLGALSVVFLAIGLGFLGSFGGGDTDTPTADLPYQNEDYQVPEADTNPPGIPAPETNAQVQQYLVDNPVYLTTVGRPVECEVGAVDPAATDAQLQAQLNDYMACLMRVWGPTLEEAGFEAVRPTVTVYSSPVQTPCGDVEMNNAAYCAGDQQVYVASDVLDIAPRLLQSQPFMIETVLAHEFGHAVQARTGILVSEFIMEDSADTDTERFQWSRRLEVQADCFAGLFIGSVSDSWQLTDLNLSAVGDLMYEIGDDQLSGDPNVVGNHGRGASRQFWVEEGIENTDVGVCNTFSADEDSVR